MSELKGAMHHWPVRRPHCRHQRQRIRRHPRRRWMRTVITKVYGAAHGIEGVLNDRAV